MKMDRQDTKNEAQPPTLTTHQELLEETLFYLNSIKNHLC